MPVTAKKPRKVKPKMRFIGASIKDAEYARFEKLTARFGDCSVAALLRRAVNEFQA